MFYITEGLRVEKSVNPFPNKPWFLRVCSRSLSKTLWEKEKLLITSNFSFSHSVFYLFGELSVILTLYDTCQIWALPIQQEIKIIKNIDNWGNNFLIE